jgi:hypothetical protein
MRDANLDLSRMLLRKLRFSKSLGSIPSRASTPLIGKLMKVNTLRFGEFSPGEAPSASKRVADGAPQESRIQTMSLVLESLWLFYEAMHSGKPLSCGDERLAQMRAALKNPPRSSDCSRESLVAAETGGISKRL